MGYRADLDGIRCIAVLLVLIFHFELVPLGDGGFVGVDVFFVLSGYLISGLVWRDLSAGTFTLREFYVRRLRRLGPSLLVVQLAALLFAAVLWLPKATLNLAWQSLYTQLYVVNFHFWRSIDYFGLHTRHQPLLHCWSLAVEEQFYFVFPLLALITHRYIRAWWPHVLLVGTVLSFGLNLVLVHSKPEAAFYLLPTRAWELLAGALIPYLAPLFVRPLARNIAGVAGIVLLTVTVLVHDPSIAFPGWFAVLPTVAAMILALAGTESGSWVSRVLSARSVVYVGKISYSLYLVHWPIRVFTDSLVEHYTLAWRIAGFGLSFLLAALIYHLVEDPVRHRKLLPKTRAFVGAYVALVGLIVGCAVWGIRSQGWEGRFSDRALTFTRYADDTDLQHRNCEKKKGQALSPDCLLGAVNVPPTFAIIGDSHAMALGEAFNQALLKQGKSGVLMARHGCLPLLELDDPGCQEFTRDVFDLAMAPDQGENVVLVSIWRRTFDTGMFGPGGSWLVGPAAEAAFAQQFAATLAKLHAAGKKTYVWMGLPASPTSLPEALARNEAYGTELPTTSTRTIFENDFKHLQTAVDANAHLIAGTISAANRICPDETCRFVIDGRPIFSDNNHPTLSSAQFFSDVIVQSLAASAP